VIDRLLASARQLLAKDYAQVASGAWRPDPQPPAEPVSPGLIAAEPETSRPGERSGRGRPMSEPLRRTINALAANPRITPAALAADLGVTGSYARTLLRRARERHQTQVENYSLPAERRPEPSGPPPVRQDAITVPELLQRLSALELQIAEIRTARLAPVSGTRWDLSRRDEVIRRSLDGQSPDEIAEATNLARDEAAFIMKVHRLLTAAP
jgi:hypothetical protein